MTMTASAANSYDVSVLDSIDAAERVWRELETRAVLTPYQRFDWLQSLAAAGAEAGNRAVIAVLSKAGVTRAIVPLALERRLGLRAGRLWGSEVSNADWIVAEPGFAPDEQALKAIFAQISLQVGGIDLLSFQNLPASWGGMANPLLRLPHTPAASNLYFTHIGGTEKPFIGTRLAPKSRSDLRRSRRRMDETMGPVRLVRVDDEPMLDRVHAAFLEQRRSRFDEMGVDNIFENHMFRRFFRAAAIGSFRQARPTMVAHALMAGDSVAATCWGTMAGDHYSLYINSTDSGEASKFRLMNILLAELMDELLDIGITTFDLGLGDFSYKERWTEPQAVFNSLVPLTPAGRLAAFALTRRTAIKRTIKQNPKLWQAASTVRRLLFRLKPGK